MAIVEAVRGSRASPWLWAFLAMLAVAGALLRRLIVVGRERDAALAAAGDENLAAWLDRRIDELRGLLRRLDGVLAEERFEPEKARAVEGHFFDINAEIDRRLHTAAPEWVDYFAENPSRFPMSLTFVTREQFRRHLVAVIESTIDQIAHIRARVG